MKKIFTKFCITLSTVVIITLTVLAIAGIHVVKFFRRFKPQEYKPDDNQLSPVQHNIYSMAEILKVKEEVCGK